MSLKANLLKLWKDPVWSNVIAAGILGLLGYVFYQAWPQLQSLTPSLRLVTGLTIGILLAASLLLLLRRYSRSAPKTLVFLSSGGTCRDPMAKAITTKLLENTKGKHPITIRAVGLGPVSKPTASDAAMYVIKEMYNKDLLANHKPELLTAELAQEADLILAMVGRYFSRPGKRCQKRRRSS
jgi:protein-tyrosine-phosphatase